MIKSKKGITLIALVVTIVVLLILAGVSISLVIDNNGIIKRSKDVKRSYATEQIKEEVELAYSSVRTDLLTEKITEDEVAKKLGEELGVSVSETDKDYNFNYKGEDITISKTTGKVTGEKEDTESEIKWIYNENSDGNIEITGIDFSEYPQENMNFDRAFDGISYIRYCTIKLTNSTLIIPEKINGKDVVKFSLEDILVGEDFDTISILGITKIQSKAKLEEFSTKWSYNYFRDLTNIELPESTLKIDCDFGKYIIYSSSKTIYRTVTINFVNGKNSKLTIPEDKWGAKKIISNGEVLYEGPDSEQITE